MAITKQNKPKFDVEEIERFLRVRGWKQSEDDYGVFLNANESFSVVIDAQVGWMEIWHFEHIEGTTKTGEECVSDELHTLEELERVLVSVGAMEWECLYCGETGGEPRTLVSREEYGADADGNRGEMRTYEEEGCSKCIRTVWAD